jgi:hypothetical protein
MNTGAAAMPAIEQFEAAALFVIGLAFVLLIAMAVLVDEDPPHSPFFQ